MSITKTSILALAFAGVATAAFAESDDNASSAAVWAGLNQPAAISDVYASALKPAKPAQVAPQYESLPTQTNN